MWPESVSKKDLRFGYSEDQRSQTQNKRTAFRRLAEKLVPLMKREEARRRYAAGHERVRTYHQPDQRVTDKRVPGTQWRYDDVINGSSLGDIVDAIRAHSEEGTT